MARIMSQFIPFCALIFGLPFSAGAGTKECYGMMKFGENLVMNPSFEEDADGDGFPDGWNLPSELCAWDEVEKRSGKRSLRFTNTDPNVYRLITQVVPCKPKRRCYFAVWVKGKEVGGKDQWDQGAGICLEWHDAKGNWLGGSYPQCPEGTFDWQKVEGTALIPENASRVSVVLYLRRTNTGTAWFDDVEVREILPTPLQIFLPTYRGLWRVGVPIYADVEIAQMDEGKGLIFRVRSQLEDDRGKVVWSKDIVFPAQVLRQQIAPPMNLLIKPTVYRWRFTPISQKGEKIGEIVHIFRLAGRMPKVYVDEKLRLIVDGKPFFPLGLYLGPTEEEHLARIAEAGFNTILCYGYGVGKDPEGYMDRAAKYGLRVIYSVKDFYEGTQYFPKWLGKSGLELAKDYVLKLRNHPALLAWYINDELPPTFVPRLKAMYDLISELDPNHPTFQVLYQIGELAHYFNCTDIIGVDPYPVPRSPLTMVADWTESARKEMRHCKPVWVVPQIFAWSIYSGKPEDREPTLGEKRCMAYLALIHGANGLIFYSYFDLFREIGGKMAEPEVFERRWKEVRQLAQELASLSTVLLEGEATSVKFEPSETSIHLRCLRKEREIYVLVANPSDEKAEITLSMPFKANVRLSSEGLKARWDGKKLRLEVAPKEGGFLCLKRVGSQ